MAPVPPVLLESRFEYAFGTIIFVCRWFCRWKTVGFKKWSCDDYFSISAWVWFTVMLAMLEYLEKNWQVIPNPGSKCPRNPEPSSGRAHSNLLSRVLRSDQHQHCNRNGKCCVCLLNVPGKECILTEHTNRTDAMLIVMPFFLLKDTKISIWRQASLSPMLQNLGWHADMLVGKSRSASSSPSVCLSWL
ncbi:hypothetical protein MPH_04667 [Macrophomina phaseolina MS6]|uniref:Uncharacterized protein n=1 Tax=Macrophomina phaseolina (strain MS6) TaxID=1126212 RepID=K2SMZ2_MACPH|nr:hypothetical protein MPH_04667 [Macrophomina phaseolina MS6]